MLKPLFGTIPAVWSLCRQQECGFSWRRRCGGSGDAVHAPSGAWLPPTGRPVHADSHPPSMHPSTPSQEVFNAMQVRSGWLVALDRQLQAAAAA